MNRRIVAVAIVLTALGVALWLVLHRPAGADDGEVRPTARVTVAPLVAGSIAQTVEGFGVIEAAPGGDVVQAAPYDSLVSDVQVSAGARVKRGDVLLVISPGPDSRLALDAARSALVVAEHALTATQERYDLRLAIRQDLIVAEQGERDARARVRSLEDRGQAGDGKIRAPADGIVSKLEVARGSLVALGTPLVTIATLERLEARVDLEASARSLLARRQPVTVTSLDDWRAGAVRAQVGEVGTALSVLTGSVQVRVALPANASLTLGEHVRALIETERRDRVLVVPRTAVLPDGHAQVLYTVRDGKAVRHEVAVGIATGDRIEVRGSGLKAGDTVVIVGNYELAEGMAVQPEDAPSPTATDTTATPERTQAADRDP